MLIDETALLRVTIGNMQMGDIGLMYDDDDRATAFLRCEDLAGDPAVLIFDRDFIPRGFPRNQHVVTLGRATLLIDPEVSVPAMEAERGDAILRDRIAIMGFDPDDRTITGTDVTGLCTEVVQRVGYRAYPNWEIGIGEGDSFIRISSHFRPQ